MPTAYPAHWEADVVLRDGGTAHVRPITPEDADAIQEMHLKQSPESIYLRFFAPMPRISDKDMHRFTHVDHKDRVAFVVLVGEQIIGIGRYDRVNERDAEVAFNIADAHQGRGLGSVLLEHLAAAARERSIHRFVAEVLPQNRKMVGVFKDAGYEVAHHFEDGVISMEFSIDPTEKSIAVMASREHRAEANSLAGLLRARSVAIVGAGRNREGFGNLVLRNLLHSEFTGRIHVVHPELEAIMGMPCVRRLTDIEGGVDLALLAVSSENVMNLLPDCAAAKVRGLVVYTSGFAESGQEGVELQQTLVRRARGLGMRVIGPNTLGLVNNHPDVRLNATPAKEVPVGGTLGLFAQSAALGVAVLAAAARRGLSISSFVSAGNRADVSGNDLMQYWAEDEDTEVVALYLESSGNPRKFSRIARKLSEGKPTIVVKSTQASGLPPGHTVRQTRAPHEAYDALLQQAGVIRVDNIHQMFDVAQLLTAQRLPTGNRLGIVANSATLAAIVRDAAMSQSLEPIAEMSLTPESSMDEVHDALVSVIDNPKVDAVIACFIPAVGSSGEDLVHVVDEAEKATDKTLAACFLGVLDSEHEGIVAHSNVPAYPTPEDAVRAMAAATHYGAWRARDTGGLVNPDGVNDEEARAIIETALADADQSALAQGAVRLPQERVVQLLNAYGITLHPSKRVHTPEEAIAVAEELGWPAVLKYASRRVRDRMHSAGYRMPIHTPEEMRTNLQEMVAGVPPRDTEAGFFIQSMAPLGTPVSIHTTEDPLFGPVLSFGLHGDPVDLLGDVAHKIPPLSHADVHDIVREVKAGPRLFGHKGSPRLDIEGLEDLIARVSRLSEELPEVAELELKPIMVAEDRVVPLNCRIWIHPPLGRADDGARRFI